MIGIDYMVILFYVIGVFVVGGIYGRKIKNSKDMFAAGQQSPWWVSGLSGFMTMFSAGTFVVWGGIAYKHGLVAISINLCYGIAALLVGYFIAGKWRDLGVNTPAEFIQLRFGKGAIHFYTWTMMIYRIAGVGVALYSLAVIITALMPLDEGNILRDAVTGNLSVAWAVVILGSIVVIYTMVGGLWAVLMTDVLQFIVLNLAVLFVVPLAFMEVGGFGAFIDAAPAGFFSFTNSEFTWLFLGGWCAIHYFMLGAEWAFVQRYLCVPEAKDAKKSSYLFGILYLVSPFLWLLPPLIYRVINPDANHEEAYILACQAVLPAGMLGLMLAAMFSATASMVSSQLNVFAGVLTGDFYHRLLRPKATENHLVFIGRILTVVLGGILILIAVSVPFMGGAESVILSITSLLVAPLLLPSVWGLVSKRIKQSAIWPTAIISFILGGLLKFGYAKGGFFTEIESLSATTEWLQANMRSMEIVVGVIVPVAILTIIELTSRGISDGWNRIADKSKEQINLAPPVTSRLPALIVAWSIGICGLLMITLSAINPDQAGILLSFAVFLFLISASFGWYYWYKGRQRPGLDGGRVSK